MDIIAKLNAGKLHQAARETRPECVDDLGNIHCSAERAAFVDWARANGPDHPEYALRYVPSR